MASYTIPSLRRGEVSQESRSNKRPDDCPQCRPGFPVQHWPSRYCRSSFRPDDKGVDRLSRVHCTCDLCF
ncbi:hypothetical protein ACWDVX_33790 [Streptomyces tendae]